MAVSYGYSSRIALCPDQFAELMGIHPLAFNNIDISGCVPEWMPPCDFFNQYSYQNPYNIEDVATYIFQAEQLIENYIESKLGFTQIIDETIEIPAYYRQESTNLVYGNQFKLPVNAMKFKTKWKGVEQFGVIKYTPLIQPTLTYYDYDLDGFKETAEVSFTDVKLTKENLCDLYVSYPGKQSLKICPFTIKSFNEISHTVILSFNTWLLRKESTFQNNFNFIKAIDGCDINNFLTSVDVYLMELDTCKAQVKVVWTKKLDVNNLVNWSSFCGEGCETFEVPACVTVLDECEGLFKIELQSYDKITGCVINEKPCNLPCIYPSHLLVNYMVNGCDTDDCTTNCSCGVCPDLKLAIAYLTATLLPERLCNCQCFNNKLIELRTDTAIYYQGGPRFSFPFSVMSNPFGSKYGAIQSFQLVQNWLEMNLC